MKIALIDLDGIVADSSERFSRARMENGKLNWKVALDPALVSLDTLIPGATKALDSIRIREYDIAFLTGRPETMEDATLDWFHSHDIEVLHLVMRPEGDYRKAHVFKLQEIEKIIKEMKPDDLLFIDDILEDHPDLLAWLGNAHCYTSLDACVADLQKRDGWLYPDHPF